MTNPKIYADFNNADKQGRVRLNCVGTSEDLARQRIELREGLQLTLYDADLDENGQSDDLMADGLVSFSELEKCWVAAIDWTATYHASELAANEQGIREELDRRIAAADANPAAGIPWEEVRAQLRSGR